MKEIIRPIAIKEIKSADNGKNLLKKQTLQIGLAEKYTTVFEDGDYVILDFGKEMCGGVRILTHYARSAKMRLRFGESLTECCSDIGGEKNATNDHAVRDFEVALPFYSDMTFGNTGFRFLRVDFYGHARVKTIVAVNKIVKKTPCFVYNGKDERIREIYEVAKRTVDLCAAEGYVWDGVKRDRLVWVGDMHPEMLALTTLYGRFPVLEKSLDFSKKQTPLPGWMNNFPTYSMWWIIIQADYYQKTKAKEYIAKQIDYMDKLVEQMDGCVKEDGTLNYPAYFVDWPTREQPDEEHGVRAINIMAIQKAIALLEEFGRDTTVAKGLLSRLMKKEILPKTAKQVVGLKYFAVGISEEDKKMLVEGNAKGMSTFMSYYVLKAVASFNKEKAIEMMKEYYGAMLDKGATTFWEDFDMAWVENSCCIDEYPKAGERDIHGDFGAFCYKGYRHSLCHGWSAGVLQFIQEECN